MQQELDQEQFMLPELTEEDFNTPEEYETYMSEEVTGIDVGPVSIDYGNIWLDAVAGTVIVVLVVVGYYWKKRIDKKFK